MNEKWVVSGCSVRGYSHKIKGIEKQDYFSWFPETNNGLVDLPIILAVSDGHGDPQCFRSKTGAEIAVNTAIEVIKKYVSKNNFNYSDLKVVRHFFEDKIPREISETWRRKVDQDIKKNPFLVEEFRNISKSKTIELESINKNPYLAYGATLITVVVAKNFISFIQLGDGDILTVNKNGEVEEAIPPDSELYGSETYSLCMPKAWRNFKVKFKVVEKEFPVLIQVSTDGYSNSFSSRKNFLKTITDYLDIIGSEGYEFNQILKGFEKINDNIEQWLDEASVEGSGDDITLAFLGNLNALQSYLKSESYTGSETRIQEIENFQNTKNQEKEHNQRSKLEISEGESAKDSSESKKNIKQIQEDKEKSD